MPTLQKREWTKEEMKELAGAMEKLQLNFANSMIAPILNAQAGIQKMMESIVPSIGILDSFKPIDLKPFNFMKDLPTFELPEVNHFNLQHVPYTPPPINYHSYREYDSYSYDNEPYTDNFGFQVTLEGLFKHNDYTLKGLNLGSKAGKLFQLYLVEDENFVSDQVVKNEIGVTDPLKGVGYIQKDLVKALKNEGFTPSFRRTRSVGNKLVDIKKTIN